MAKHKRILGVLSYLNITVLNSYNMESAPTAKEKVLVPEVSPLVNESLQDSDIHSS